MSSFRKICCLLILFNLAFFIQSAVAQEEDTFMLEEMVVTAEKRAADVQDVPIAMSVISTQEVNKQSVIDVGGMVALVPELNFRPDTVFNSFTIRGVGSYDNGEMADQAITLAVDGEYINRPLAMNATMFDIERVEVLRGPQGTLYGKNATGGAINIIANKPKDKFEASLFGEVGNYSAIKTRGMINAPLSDSFYARAAFMTSNRDGYIDGGELVGDIVDEGVMAGRLGFLYEPNERLSWYVAGEMSKVDQDAPAQYGLAVSEIAPAGSSPADLDLPLPKDFDVATAGFVESEQFAIRTQFDYDFDFADFSYVAGYRNVDFDGYQPLNGFVPEIFSFDNHLAYETQSHELRLQKETDKIFIQGGYFYGYETQDVARGLFLPMVPFMPGAYLNFFMRDIESTTYALFAQGSYNATDTVKLTAGLRNTWDEKKRKSADAFPFSFAYPNPPASYDEPGTYVPDIPSEGDWSQLTWLLGVDWQVTPERLLFAKISTGYKAGGFDNIGAYDPELLTAYEVGSKNRFLDNRLQLNLSAFFYDYTDQQTVVFISTEVGHGVQNAGSTETFGVEADMEWLLTAADRFTAKVRYLNAEFKDLPTTANVVGAPSVEVNLKGNKPVQSPEWSLSLGYDHSWALSWGELTASVKTNYKSEYYLQPFNWKMDTQDAYTMSDASLTFASFKGNWDVTAYVHNIEDERLLTFSAFTGNGIDIYNWIMGTPRTYGVQLRYRWGD